MNISRIALKVSADASLRVTKVPKYEPDAKIGHKVPFRSLRLSAKVSLSVQRGQRIVSENGYSLMDE